MDDQEMTTAAATRHAWGIVTAPIPVSGEQVELALSQGRVEIDADVEVLEVVCLRCRLGYEQAFGSPCDPDAGREAH